MPPSIYSKMSQGQSTNLSVEETIFLCFSDKSLVLSLTLQEIGLVRVGIFGKIESETLRKLGLGSACRWDNKGRGCCCGSSKDEKGISQRGHLGQVILNLKNNSLFVICGPFFSHSLSSTLLQRYQGRRTQPKDRENSTAAKNSRAP